MPFKSSSIFFCEVLFSFLVYGDGAPTANVLQPDSFKGVSNLPLISQDSGIIYEKRLVAEKREKNVTFNMDLDIADEAEYRVIFKKNGSESENRQMVSRDIENIERKLPKKKRRHEVEIRYNKDRRRYDEEDEEDNFSYAERHSVINTDRLYARVYMKPELFLNDGEFLFK